MLSTITMTDRLEVLYNLNLLDSGPAQEIERITASVKRVLDIPVVLFTLIDCDRQYFKSSRGLPPSIADFRQTDLDYSMCKHVVGRAHSLAIPDTTADPLVCDNLAVTELGARSYLGAPVIIEGQAIGGLCAIGFAPRQWSRYDMQFLDDMARFCASQIMLHHVPLIRV